MNISVLNSDIQAFINENLTTELPKLLLKKSPFPEVSMLEIVEQIKGKTVAAKKFPFLLYDGIIFPPHLNLEQSSSEATSKYKSELITGKKFLDLTTGFGIDAYFLSKNFSEIILVEKNSELLEIVEHNWNSLNRNAVFINEDLEDFLSKNEDRFDLIYLDPARRDSQQKKVFLLEDLSPNILEIQKQLLKRSETVLIKLSPLIDLSYLISVLKNLSGIHIIAVRNEVKEILITLKSKFPGEKVKCICTNLESKEPDFTFYFDEEKKVKTTFSEVLKYLYIPNNTLLKSGAFNTVGKRFILNKIHPNSHFYTSDAKIINFPGRTFEVETIDPKSIKRGERFNIISKNYPLNPEAIKNKYKIKDGGDHYLIFTQTLTKKVILKSL